MKKFLLIDDHAIITASLAKFLADLYTESIIDQCQDIFVAEEMLDANTNYDLVILDVLMPGAGGTTLSLMHHIHKKFPGLKVLMFSMASEGVYARPFIHAGAFGYASKNAELSQLKKAIAQVLSNRMYLSEYMMDIFLDDARYGKQNPFERLSVREFNIADFLIKGIPLKDIATSQYINISTVSTYRDRLFKKLHVKNIVELIQLARIYNVA